MQIPCVNTLSRWLIKGSIATVLITCASWSTISIANDKFGGIPGERTCFFRYGPVSADPYINVAYPDAAVKYWGAAFTVPDGAKLRLEGQFPHSRYMSFISYDDRGCATRYNDDVRIQVIKQVKFSGKPVAFLIADINNNVFIKAYSRYLRTRPFS